MLRKFFSVTSMPCDLRNSLHTSPLFNSLRMNGATLLTQSGGNPLIERNGRNMSLCFWSLTLWKLNTQSKINQSKLILKVSTVTKTMDLVEVYLPSQLKLLISVSEKVISKCTKNPMEMVLAEIHPRTPLEIFQNGSPRILLVQIWNIWQQPPWTTTKIHTNGLFLKIMLMVRGDHTGNIYTNSGNKIKAGIRWFNFMLLKLIH